MILFLTALSVLTQASAFTAIIPPFRELNAVTCQASRAVAPGDLSLELYMSSSPSDSSGQDCLEDDLSVFKRDIVVSSEVSLPFSATVAFDAFSDLPRQPSWSKWLKSVEYIDTLEDASVCKQSGIPLRQTRWTLGYRGLRFSWDAVSTVLDRPNRIDWESTSGLKNLGSVQFVEHKDGADMATIMTLSIKLSAPRIFVKLLRKSESIGAFVENKMLARTLKNFRDIVMEEDLKISFEKGP